MPISENNKCYCGSGQWYRCNEGDAWDFNLNGARIRTNGNWQNDCRECAEYARDQYIANMEVSRQDNKCFSCHKTWFLGIATGIFITHSSTTNVASSLFCAI